MDNLTLLYKINEGLDNRFQGGRDPFKIMMRLKVKAEGWIL